MVRVFVKGKGAKDDKGKQGGGGCWHFISCHKGMPRETVATLGFQATYFLSHLTLANFASSVFPLFFKVSSVEVYILAACAETLMAEEAREE